MEPYADLDIPQIVCAVFLGEVHLLFICIVDILIPRPNLPLQRPEIPATCPEVLAKLMQMCWDGVPQVFYPACNYSNVFIITPKIINR